jgi:guanosine-3',5'-bis(diphosphate) 3'-pyrophosphohydrolase
MESASQTLEQEEDRKLIQRAYRDLLNTIKGKLDADDAANIRMAYEMAVEAHSQQRRKSGDPYILHPIAVAKICVEEIGLGPTAVVCALLHDVVEDTDVTLADLRAKFGDKITTIVDGLTKLDNIYDVRSPQAENFKKILSTLTKDVRVVLIKIADRLHNMRTLGAMPAHSQLKIASETTYIYAPLAHRLGLYKIKTEFQDLSMKITHPDEYRDIAEKLQTTKQERNNYIHEFIMPLTKELNDIGVPYRINGRPKSIYSIWNKIKSKHIAFEEIYDLFAIRVIVDVEKKREKPVCWQVYSIVTDIHRPIPERLKDWVTTPKSNGYESLHTTVVGPHGRYVEVQIRSERMDAIAERGFAAHWKYKGISDDRFDVFASWLDNVRTSLENPSDDAVDFLNDFRSNLFSEEVYVFTPKGDMKMLPLGATALDFAFDIHSEVGCHCAAIKVNNKLVSMSQVLQNGDQVSVLTNKNQKPNEDWLKMVITGKARSRIRAALKDEIKKKGEIGQETLARKFSQIKIDFEANVDEVVKFYGFNSRLDLYYAIYSEQVNLQELRSMRIDKGKLVIEKPKPEFNPPPQHEARQSENLKKTREPQLLIDGLPASQFPYSLATCCNPVQGDEVFAYTTVASGVKVHRTSCPNATNLMANYGYRVMKAEWTNSANTNFVADLRITGVDGKGVAQKLTGTITHDLGLEMRSISLEGGAGYFEGKISVVVNHTDQLNYAIKVLKAIDGVSSVMRV